jgi:riboflavin transporter FmnP
MKKVNIKRITFVAVFAAITSVLYCYVKFPLPIFPSFLDVNFSMIPIIIAAFMLGPIDGVIIVVIRFIMKLILVGTGTQYVGEIADLVLGVITTTSCGLVYMFYKGKFRTLLSFATVIVSWVICSIVLNIFLNIPIYVELFFKGNWNILIGMCNDAFNLITFNNCPEITQNNFIFYYVILAVIPFNLMLSSLVVAITALVHKRLKVIYDKI